MDLLRTDRAEELVLSLERQHEIKLHPGRREELVERLATMPGIPGTDFDQTFDFGKIYASSVNESPITYRVYPTVLLTNYAATNKKAPTKGEMYGAAHDEVFRKGLRGLWKSTANFVNSALMDRQLLAIMESVGREHPYSLLGRITIINGGKLRVPFIAVPGITHHMDLDMIRKFGKPTGY
ncbi:MAG: hypothetical protein AABW73_02000 [Nanoarchaeota archaeon]